jgi:hypothetical protein
MRKKCGHIFASLKSMKKEVPDPEPDPEPDPDPLVRGTDRKCHGSPTLLDGLPVLSGIVRLLP